MFRPFSRRRLGVMPGKNTFLDQLFAESDAVIVVDMKQGDGDTADRRAADEASPLPAEMLRPFVASGIEKRCELAYLRVQAAQVRTFKRITIKAT